MNKHLKLEICKKKLTIQLRELSATYIYCEFRKIYIYIYKLILDKLMILSVKRGGIRGDLKAKVGRENIFKPTIGNESLRQDSNDNGVRIVHFATSKNLVVKGTMFPHRDIHKHN